MDGSRGGAADSNNAQTHRASPTSTTTHVRSSTTSSSSQRWIFGKDITFGCGCLPKRERAPNRESVTYPSNTSFEATIVKGTARTSRGYVMKPRLVDLDRVRRKMQNLTRNVSRRSLTARSSSGGGSEGLQPEPARTTSSRTAAEMDRGTQSDASSLARGQSPFPREPERPFRDKIPGKHFSGATGRLEEEASCYKSAYRNSKEKGA